MDSFDYVLMIAEEKNMTKAAARLFITQPALTIRINRLEESLGFKIFDRSKSPIEITKEGDFYIHEMLKIRQSEEKLLKTLQKMLHKNDHHLTIGIGLNRGRFWLPILLPRLKELDPELTLQVSEASDGMMETMLKKDEIDIGIMGSSVLSPELASILLGREQVFFAVPDTSPILKGAHLDGNNPKNPYFINKEQLNGQTFIQGEQPYGLTRFNNLIFSLYQIRPKNIINVGNSETAYWLAGSGIGIASTLSQYYYLSAKAEGQKHPVFCSVKEIPMERNIILACKRSREEEELIQWVAGLFRELFFKDFE